jgi:hypothetical protein
VWTQQDKRWSNAAIGVERAAGRLLFIHMRARRSAHFSPMAPGAADRCARRCTRAVRRRNFSSAPAAANTRRSAATAAVASPDSPARSRCRPQRAGIRPALSRYAGSASAQIRSPASPPAPAGRRTRPSTR